jgi:uncharacterized membrane protein
MKDTTVAAVALLASEVILLAVFAWMPLMRGERAFFGARVARETYRGEGRRLLRRYWQTLVAVFVLTGAVGYYSTMRTGQPLPSILASLAAAAAAFLVYAFYARRVRPFAVAGGETRFASSLKARRLDDYTLPWLEASVVLLTCASFAVLGYFYPRLPEQLPVHWNLSGEADRWARKSFSTVFFLPVLGVYMQVLFFVLKRDLVQAKLTLPATHAEEYLRGKERFLKANMRTMDWARAGVAVIFFNIALLTIFASLPELNRYTTAVNAAILSAAVLMVGGIVYFIWRMAAINGELEELTGDEYVQRAAEEKHWRHGGLTYYNPEDPSLVVEKLVGLGYTLNMAHRAVRTRLLLLAGVPLFVLWAIFSL